MLQNLLYESKSDRSQFAKRESVPYFKNILVSGKYPTPLFPDLLGTIAELMSIWFDWKTRKNSPKNLDQCPFHEQQVPCAILFFSKLFCTNLCNKDMATNFCLIFWQDPHFSNKALSWQNRQITENFLLWHSRFFKKN